MRKQTVVLHDYDTEDGNMVMATWHSGSDSMIFDTREHAEGYFTGRLGDFTLLDHTTEGKKKTAERKAEKPDEKEVER